MTMASQNRERKLNLSGSFIRRVSLVVWYAHPRPVASVSSIGYYTITLLPAAHGTYFEIHARAQAFLSTPASAPSRRPSPSSNPLL